MKTRIYSILLVVFVTFFSNIAYSQSRSFENILKMKLRNSGVLLEDNNIRGYYFFYTLDKSTQGRRNYLLRILDQNLNDIKTTDIEESKSVALVEARYNSKNIMLKLIDYRDKRAIFMSFDRNGELIKKEEKKGLNVYDLAMYGKKNNPKEANNLRDITNVGFIDYGMSKTGKGYYFTMYPTDPNATSNWTYSSNTKEKGFQYAGILEASDKVVFNAVIKKKSRTAKDADYYLQGLEIKTGKKLFETSLTTEKYVHQPLTAYYDKANNLMNIMGVYYLPDKKVMKDNGLGLFRISMDDQGNMVNPKYLAWAGDFSKHVHVSNKGQIGDEKSYVYFHNIVQNPDGSILAVGEQYRKAADAAGIAVNMLSAAMGGYSNASYTKVVIEDMVIGHFSPDFEIKSIEFIEKTKSDFSLPSGYDFVNIHYLALFVKAYGGFDYMYTQNIDKDNATAICYLDYEKQEKGGKKWVFGAATFKDGTFIKDKMVLDKVKSQDRINILPAKPGYIMVVEYLKSEKKIDVHLERINY